MRIHTMSAVLLLLYLSTTAAAQSYTIKTKDYATPGKSVVVFHSATTRSTFRWLKDDMVVKEETMLEVDDKEFIERVLEAGMRLPNKFTHTFTRATKGKPGEPIDRSFAGKTIVYERKGDKYVVTAKEDGVDASDLQEFAKHTNSPYAGSDLKLPKHAVKVGENWPLDKTVAQAMAAGNDRFDVESFKGHGKLVKTYKKGGHQWGTIETSFRIAVKKLGPLVLDQPIPFESTSTLDIVIDGSSTEHQAKHVVRMRGRSDVTVNDMTFVLEVSFDGDNRHEQTAEK
jgi:hypothetical protein